jgi:hypothetical protein
MPPLNPTRSEIFGNNPCTREIITENLAACNKHPIELAFGPVMATTKIYRIGDVILRRRQRDLL